MIGDAYPSSEDTHLLLDVLLGEKTRLPGSLQAGGMCIEIGYVVRIVLLLKLTLIKC